MMEDRREPIMPRLHRATWFCMLVTVASLTVCQVTVISEDMSDGIAGWPQYMGWPFDFVNGWRLKFLLGNIVVGIAIVSCVVFSVENACRSRRHEFRFGLRTIFLAVMLCATVFGEINLERELAAASFKEFGQWNINPEPYPWIVRIPILFGIGCVAFTAWRIVRRCARQLNVRFGREVEFTVAHFVPAVAHLVSSLGTGSALRKNFWRVAPARGAAVFVACAVGAVALLLAGIALFLETTQREVEPLPGEAQVVPNDPMRGEGPLPAIAPFDAQHALAHQEAWAKHLGSKVEIENSLGMKLRLIPPGEFVMGSPQAEIDALVESTTDEAGQQRFFRSEGPQHRVKLTQAFYLGSCEVTQQQYQELMGANPSHFSRTGPGKDTVKVKDLQTSEFPVEMVSWFDALDFCNKLSEREQRPPYYLCDAETVVVLGGSGYRLPTEAEWEYACRAGSTTRWSFGDSQRDLAKHAWWGFNSRHRTHRVGQLRANPFGVFDMHGNVCEWCWDSLGEYAAAVSDPTAHPATTGSGRVVRGGAFIYFACDCRSASRDAFGAMFRNYDCAGFRVCRGH